MTDDNFEFAASLAQACLIAVAGICLGLVFLVYVYA